MRAYALLSYPEYGYDYDKEKVKKLDSGRFYEIDRISMGQSHTSIFLKGIQGCFNSVQFTFYNRERQPIDIYRMPEFNQYR